MGVDEMRERIRRIKERLQTAPCDDLQWLLDQFEQADRARLALAHQLVDCGKELEAARSKR